MRLLRLPLALVLFAAAAGAAGAQPARLTAAQVRAFVARQDRAWNAGDLAAFFATYAPGATFVSQARNSQGGVTPFGRSTLAQAQAQARRVFARGRPSQQTTVEQVLIAPDGRSARMLGRQSTHSVVDGRVQTLCGETEQMLALAGGRIVSRGEIDTAVRCRH